MGFARPTRLGEGFENRQENPETGNISFFF